MKFENTEVWGFKHALRGMRNPLNSWSKSDSLFDEDIEGCLIPNRQIDKCEDCKFFNGFNKPCLPVIGENDMNLAKRLIAGGSEHRKFLRQIIVSVDITAPLYWWKEFDTYKVGTVANSTSTMHTIHKKEFELDDFSHENLKYEYIQDGISYFALWAEDSLKNTINKLNRARELFLKTKDKKYWWLMIQLLPTSYNQTRTITMNYENLRTMYHQRKNHKLNEWSGCDNPELPNFISWIESLPYAKEFIME